MGKTTQTGKAFYCTTCQKVGEYDIEKDTPIDNCATQHQYITNELWNQMIKRLQAIESFGSKDTADTRKPKEASELSEKEDWDFINFSDYKKLLTSLGDEVTLDQHDSILGSYSNDLKEAVLNYQIPSTRYKDTTYQCCDACESSCQGCYTCQNCNTHNPCGSCNQNSQNCVSIYYGSSCPSCNRFQ